MPREDLPIINANNAFHMKAAHALLDTYKGRGNIRIEITVCRNQRTLSQNAYYHGVVLPCIAKALAENEGTSVNTDQTHYLDKVIAFARDELMVHVPPPDDYRNEQPEPKRKTA